MSTELKTHQLSMTVLMSPEMANFSGKVHGGAILRLLDQVAYACASRYAGSYVVTLSVDQVMFRQPIAVGELVTFLASVNHTGTSSMEIGIKVVAEDILKRSVRHANSCFFTMVAVDDDGKPTPVPPLVLETADERRRHAAALIRRQLREVADRLCGLPGTLRGLAGDLPDHAHGAGDVRGRGRLLLGGDGDVLDEGIEGVGYALDLGQRGTGVLGQARTGHHFGRGLLHRGDRFVSIGLNGLDQVFDASGRTRGTFCQALHFVGHDRETAARFTRRRRLDRRVQREDVRLLRDVVDEFNDRADFLRALA